MSSYYQLVDLQSMSEDEIVEKKHLGMMEYVMKHIHQRDTVALLEKFLQTFALEILVDKEKGYIYIKLFLWYTGAKLSEGKQVELEQVLVKYLSEDEKGNIMRTIAQKYIEEGEFRGIQIGKVETVQEMLKEGYPIETISKLTKLSLKAIEVIRKDLAKGKYCT